MAVYAAHLTRTLGGTPSAFQIVAQDALGGTVKPALRKLAEYFAAVYPNKCTWLVDWYDELYLVFDCCLQYHYLKHYAASFSESFYGLLRVPTQVSGEFSAGQRLPAAAERASLALLVLLPYVTDKAQRAARRWAEAHEDGRLGKGRGDRLRAAAARVYGVCHLAAWGARLLCVARYTAGRARSPTPALAALRLTLREAPPAPHAAGDWPDYFRSVRSGHFGSPPPLGGAVLRCVEYGAFVVQLLAWWEARHRHHAALPAPPPPPQRAAVAARLRNRCPLCGARWQCAAALPVSGLVFCYGCIAPRLRAARACPVTRLPARADQLVRVYVDD